ncbi:hypothetical protein [Pontibacter actiniarum]|uniref:EF-hand domain-containing protein n=1 Tax=Pontibacter actiniarum TaxID=323450 RepID=A0A1X9YRX3_9BACT|nr:hypothetical protein [Pontibacter actiniarum]ARS35625.1 hypothetical protein CA264_09320 [Pontibacter actiniarum]
MKTREINLFKLLRNGACFALLAGLVACGGENYETAEENEVVATNEVEEDAGVMDNWDTDRFNTTFASNNRYGDWDENDDELLDENEFNSGFYDTWDQNDDELIDENEWSTATRDYGMADQNWSEWDANSDNNLDENEFRTGFANSNYYNDWDADRDKMINEREYSDGVFSAWDQNDDNMLDNNEYDERYNRYYGS